MSDQTKHSTDGGHFDRGTLSLLRGVLQNAWASLTPEIQAKTSRSELAAFIVNEAANGEREPEYLKACILAEVADRLLRKGTLSSE